jgi:multidrug resistance efflux pump
MEIRNIDLVNFSNNFATFDGITGYKFLIALNRANNKIVEEVKIIEKLKEQSEGFKEFSKEATALYQKYAEKDESGNIRFTKVSETQQRIMIDKENVDKLTADMSKIEKKYKKEIEEHEKKELDYSNAIMAKSTLVLDPIDEEFIPDTLDGKQTKLLFSVGLVK